MRRKSTLYAMRPQLCSVHTPGSRRGWVARAPAGRRSAPAPRLTARAASASHPLRAAAARATATPPPPARRAAAAAPRPAGPVLASAPLMPGSSVPAAGSEIESSPLPMPAAGAAPPAGAAPAAGVGPAPAAVAAVPRRGQRGPRPSPSRACQGPLNPPPPRTLPPPCALRPHHRRSTARRCPGSETVSATSPRLRWYDADITEMLTRMRSGGIQLATAARSGRHTPVQGCCCATCGPATRHHVWCSERLHAYPDL